LNISNEKLNQEVDQNQNFLENIILSQTSSLLGLLVVYKQPDMEKDVLLP
jgi:hypothetical protein